MIDAKCAHARGPRGTGGLKDEARRSPTISLGWTLPVLLIAAAVRLLGLGNANLWGDEAFSVMTSLGPPSKLLGILATSEPHPPLYPFLLAGWLRLFGSSEFVARLPSAFAGIASVAVAAALARSFAAKDGRWSATFAAVVAGILVALNPFQVWYSQEARMYAQVSFFAGLSTLALLRLWRGRRGATLLYALSVAAAAGSHYYGLFVPLAHGLAVLTSARGNRDALVRWIRAAALAALLSLPWVYVAVQIFTSYYGGPPGSENLIQVAVSSWARVIAGWSLPWSDAVTYAGILSAIALIGLVVPSCSEIDRFVRIVLAFWLFTPFVGGYLASLVRPMYNERYLIVSSVPFILLMARGIVGIWGRGWGIGPEAATLLHFRGNGEGKGVRPPRVAHSPRRPFALPPSLRVAWQGARLLGGGFAFVGALALAYVALHKFWIGEYVQSTYDTHVQTVDLLARDGDAVILDGPTQQYLYQYYARRNLPYSTLPRRTPLDPAATTAELADIARDHDGAWVLWYATALYDPGNVIGRWLALHGYRSLDVFAGNARLQYYRFTSDGALKIQSTSLTFGDSLELQRYAWLDASLPAGRTVPVDLRWHRLPNAAPHLRVALRLVDQTGFTWAETDQSVGNGFVTDANWPRDQILDDRHGLMIPTGTPPGDYLLLLNAYSADHPRPLPVSGKGAPINPAGVVLATIHVSAPSHQIWTGGIAGFHATTAVFANGVELLGYAGSDQVKAGESGYLTLFWKALKSSPDVSRLRLRLLTDQDQVAEERELPMTTVSYPATKWQTGEILREQYRLPISDRLSPGVYRVAVVPIVASTGKESATKLVVIGSVVVQKGSPPVAATPPENPVSFSLGQKIALNGFDLNTSRPKPGSIVSLTLHWADLAPVDGDYTVFVHVLNSSEKIVTQRDQPPADGKRPTSSWFPGDTILDRYTLKLPGGLPPGSYAIEVGLYSPNTGARLPVSQGGKPVGDRIILTHLQVVS
jgi:mannosyltransferase